MKFVFSIFLLYFLCAKLVSVNSKPLNASEEDIDYDIKFSLPLSIDVVQHARIGAKKCMKDLGCFEITRDFVHPLNRPINFLPQDRTLISTKFKLFTKLHPMEAHFLNEDIKDSNFDASHKTIFIVHGFFDSELYGKWMQNLKNNLLLNGNFNVIIVDWSKGNGAPYTQATANTRVVGAEIALLIKSLQKHYGISPLDCHIIGHSLGSHIAGYAGERLKKLGRITALDPAAPYFQNMPPSVRIDPTDADFVDVIHTDTSSTKFLALGMSQAVGHVDFYPNNGMSQPGCTASKIYSVFLEGLVDTMRQFMSCNHQRSVEYFTYSVNFQKALPVGYNCRSWKDFQNGRCADCGKNGEKCAVMGMKADQFKNLKNGSQPIKMYLTTAGSAPYWVYSYQVTVKLAKPTSDVKDQSGDITLTIQGSKNNQAFKLSTKTGELIHGSTYSFYVNNEKELGKMKGVSVTWNSKSWSLSLFKKPSLYVDFVKISPMYIMENGSQKTNLKKFCNKSKKAVESKKNILLAECT